MKRSCALFFLAGVALLAAPVATTRPVKDNLVEQIFKNIDPSSSPVDVQAILQEIADSHSKKYNCSISIAFKNATFTSEAAAGYIDFDKKTTTTTKDKFVWGSVTKMLTGAGILRHVDQGLFTLDSKIPPLVDPLLKAMADKNPHQNFTTLEELFGEEVNEVTIRDMLAMQSGIPDFDTAQPKGRYPTDSLRADLYAHPHHLYTPTQLMDVPWVRKGHLEKPPGPHGGVFRYSSTNFLILGLILAQAYGASSWETYPQINAIPENLRPAYSNIVFADTGAPSDHTPVHGYDETTYNNNTKHIDVSGVEGVFAGWTASDIIGSPADLAMFAYDLYGPEARIISADMVKEMIPTDPIYGLATFNLTWTTGRKGAAGSAYGHLGATYGYQSIVTYHPEFKFSLAIATNIETNYQSQPSDTLCFAFNNMMNIVQDKPLPTCVFNQSSYYGSSCQCKDAPRIQIE
mmetsp:Transcript_31956/g.38629  ORF Transcript_31956/g.38629 Transcript_31956/m.38629 type:complete len:460 (-) Transcript_31956:39-1418(-)|eukprot:CAMPEP_0197859032 /NCGR_PEP_ID=MMETSP1438-20131217/33315_1 /TAXON_ID=1461541 /ORGANISM="Pterosperma sp., Strain CCMP1384" /LENGTH=459 /DNA_ID=CAMNT_0043475395 /DNA_START=97 /DNA_END=1476 /DNA_ORIENTATION=+